MTSPTKKELTILHKRHNRLTKDEYNCDYKSFTEWFFVKSDDVDQYAEIPKNETKSGHAEILDY